MKRETDFDYLPPHGALKVQQAVELEVIVETELGYKCSIDDRYLGLVYRSEVPQPLRVGQYLKGWVKGIRDDGKIDLSITRLDSESREELDDAILRHLSKPGSAPLSDKTPSEDIVRLFGTSKKNFKRAVGRLYKERLVVIDDDNISLADKAAAAPVPARARASTPAPAPARAPAPASSPSPWKKR